MAVKVDIPIRLEVGVELLRAGSSAVIAARLAEAVKQGLEFMAAQVAADGHAGDPVVHEPTLHWTGPGLRSLSVADRARTGARLLQAVRQTCHAFAASARHGGRGAADLAGVVLDHPAAFRATPRTFFELLGRRRADRADFEARYHDELDVPHDGVAFRVRTHGMMFLDELHAPLVAALDRQLHGEVYHYFLAATPQELHGIIQLDRKALAGPLGGAPLSSLIAMGGRIHVPPGAHLVVGCLRLPQIELDAITGRLEVRHATVALRDLGPIVERAPFQAATAASWDSYRDEWGDDPIAVTVYPFRVRRRTHGQTLEALYAAQARSDQQGWLQLGGLVLATRHAVRDLPALRLAEISDDVTAALPDASVGGDWQVDWKGAYLSAWLPQDPFKLGAARYRPDARKLAARIAAVLDETSPARHKLRRLIVEAYGETDTAIDASREAFGFLLEQLEALSPRGTWLARLYAAGEAHDCLELLVKLASGTPYVHHAAVLEATARVAERRANASAHVYIPGVGVLIDRSWLLAKGKVIADHDELYMVKSTRSRLNAAGLAKMRTWLLPTAEAVVKRCVADRREMTKEEFSLAVIEEVQKHLTADDVEEVEIQRSLRLLDVRAEDDRGITRYFVAYSWVERIDGSPWQDVRDDDDHVIVKEREAVGFEGFDELLFFWSYQTSAVVALAFEKVLTYATAIWAFAELGGFVIVPHALGFIAVNVLIYLGKAAFFGGEFSLDGLMLEAVKGYAMALGFQLFAPVGRFLGTWLARGIGTTTIARYLAGLIVQRLVSGGIAGAGTGAITRFATDLVLIAMGTRQGFSSWREYLDAMGEGALVGIAFEVGSDLFRTLGKLDSFRALSAAARRAGWSPVRWWTEIGAAQARLRQWLVEVASEVRTLDLEGLIEALRETFADLAESIAEGTRQAMLRRTLTLSRIELNALSASGLGRLLEALDSSAAEALLRELATDAATAARFLEVLGALDERLVATLANRGQLAALARSPRMLAVLATRARLGLGLLDAFALDVAAAERFLTEADQLPAGVRARGLQLFEGPLAAVPGLAGRLVRRLGTKLLATVVPEGSMVTISGELTIAPEALARLSETELTTLLKVCEHPLDPALAAELGKFEGNAFRFRFRASVAARVDPWVSTMLRETGFANGSPEHAMFQRMSSAERAEMWDLPNNRGADEDIRPQAARWALGRQHVSVHQFVADFQFYVGEVFQDAERIRASLERQIDAEIRAARTANGERPLSTAARADLVRKITQQPPAPNGQGGLGQAFENLTGKQVKIAMRRRATDEMAQPGAGGRPQGVIQTDAAFAEARAHHTGPYAIVETRLPGPIDPQVLAARVRDHAATLSFGDLEYSAYHAHVHTREILPSDRVPGANEVETYLNTARENVRRGEPSLPVRSQDGDWSILFSSERGTTVVNVTPDGIATMATYMPRKKGS